MGGRTSRRRSNPWPFLMIEFLLLVVLGAVLWLRFTSQGQEVWAEFRGYDAAGELQKHAKATKERVEAEQQAAEELRKLGAIVVGEKISSETPEKSITSVRFRGEEIDDAALEHLSKLFRLESLVLAGTNLSDEQLRYISGLSRLANLGLQGTAISDAGLAHIEGITGMEALHLTNTNVSDDGLRHIVKIRKLKILDLSDTKVTDRGMTYLSALKNLTWLLLDNNDITDAGVRQLYKVESLGRLTIYGTNITPEGKSGIRRAIPDLQIDYGKAIAKAPHTERDTTYEEIIKRQSRPPRRKVTKPKKWQDGNGVLGETIDEEKLVKEMFGEDIPVGKGDSSKKKPKASLPKAGSFLEGLHHKGEEPAGDSRRQGAATNDGVEAEQRAAEQRAAEELRKLKAIVVAERLNPALPEKSITALNFRQKEIDDAALEHVSKLFRLQSLALAGTNISDEQLRYISGLSSLANLGLQGTAITDAGLAHIEGITGMEALHLTNTNVSNDGLLHIVKIRELKILDLSDTKVTDDGLKHLQTHKELKWLLLNNNDITDAGIRELHDVKSLGRLTILGTKVTREGVRQLKKANPKLQVDYDPMPTDQGKGDEAQKDVVEPEKILKEVFGVE